MKRLVYEVAQYHCDYHADCNHLVDTRKSHRMVCVVDCVANNPTLCAKRIDGATNGIHRDSQRVCEGAIRKPIRRSCRESIENASCMRLRDHRVLSFASSGGGSVQTVVMRGTSGPHPTHAHVTESVERLPLSFNRKQ